ncbi:hypothetical protein DYB26_010038, partial [Aphanomyces astaci]
MLDELMRSLEQDHQEWVVHQEGKKVVEVMTKSIKPDSLKTAVQKQLQLQRSKALKSDVFRSVNWLRTFPAGHQLYSGKPQVSRREGGREDATKNNGRVGGKAGTIVPKNAEPSAKKGCLKCGDMSHRVARCPKTAGEAETLLAAQDKRRKDGVKVLINQPQRQKTERGVLLENIVRVDDVLLDSDSDVTVVTRDVMDALDAAGVKVGTVSLRVPHLAYPYGSDAKPVVMTRSVKSNCVTLDTTCGPRSEGLGRRRVDCGRTHRESPSHGKKDFSSVPTNELSGMANVKRLMAEKLNPRELNPTTGWSALLRRFIPKPPSRTKQGTVQAILTAKAAEGEKGGLAPAEATRLHDLLAKHIDVFREVLGDDPPVKDESLKVRI